MSKKLSWSWEGIWKNVRSYPPLKWRAFFILVLVIMLITGLVTGKSHSFVFGLFTGLAIGVVALLVNLSTGVMVGGLGSEVLEKRDNMSPNQGTWRSARNGMHIGLTVGISIALIIGIAAGIVEDPITGCVAGLVGGLLVGLLMWVRYGGDACIGHLVLRVILFFEGCTPPPWDYVTFLNYSAEHILLRKIGGGYIFVHRLLLEYFTTLETSASEKVAAGSALLQKRDEKEQLP